MPHGFELSQGSMNPDLPACFISPPERADRNRNLRAVGRMEICVKNKYFTRKFVPAQYILCMYESLQAMERAWLLV